MPTSGGWLAISRPAEQGNIYPITVLESTWTVDLVKTVDAALAVPEDDVIVKTDRRIVLFGREVA